METKEEFVARMEAAHGDLCADCGHPEYQHADDLGRVTKRIHSLKFGRKSRSVPPGPYSPCWATRCQCLAFTQAITA